MILYQQEVDSGRVVCCVKSLPVPQQNVDLQQCRVNVLPKEHHGKVWVIKFATCLEGHISASRYQILNLKGSAESAVKND